MMKTEKKHIISIFGLILLSIFLVWFTTDEKIDNANYQITSGNGKKYYADTFRLVGRGLMFDDIHGKKIILTGNIDIEYRKKDK